MPRLLQAVVSVANERRHENDPVIALTIDPAPRDAYLAIGHDSRLGQVFSVSATATLHPTTQDAGRLRRQGRGPSLRNDL